MSMTSWTDFISEQYPQPLQDHENLCDLSQLSLLYVGGDDATDFLQNQLSNDIKQIDEHRAQLSSLSNAKGRMLSIFRVIRIEGGYLLLIPSSIIQQTSQHLQKYILRSQVVLSDISDQFSRFSLITKRQELLDQDIFPAEPNQVYQSDSLIVVRLQSAEQEFRYLVLSNQVQETIDLWNKLSAELAVNNFHSWRLQEIRSGVPTLYPQTLGAFVVQMANLQLIDGVNFKKGCYPGQEVVARMQYLGKLKRRMYLANFATRECPLPGDELCTENAEQADGSGKIVDAVQISEGQCLALFIAQIEKTEQQQLKLCDQPDTRLELQALPYAFEE